MCFFVRGWANNQLKATRRLTKREIKKTRNCNTENGTKNSGGRTSEEDKTYNNGDNNRSYHRVDQEKAE